MGSRFPVSRWLGPVVAAGCLMVAPAVVAENVSVMPKSNHPALTQTTDESFGFQVFPGKPLKLDLVGPGELTVNVRLNHARKRSVFKGQLNIRRGRKLIKRTRLRLHRSRVGAYKEDKGIHPSVPKVFKINVPDGLQSYTFSLRGARGVTMTLQLTYDTQADQSAARSGDDELALAPLVPPGGEEALPGDGGLVPLAPIEPEEPVAEKPPAKVAAATPPPEKKPEKPSPPEPKTPPPEKKPEEPKTAPARKSLFKKIEVASKPERKKSTAPVRTVEPPASGQPTGVKKTAPRDSAHVISLGVKLGQISPLITYAGGTTFMGSLDLRYILPVFEERLTLGVEAGFYNYKLEWTNQDRSFDTKVIPVSLQLFYRLPLATLFQLFFGAGGDVFVCMSEDSQVEGSETTIAYGGHVSIGAEAELGPGFLLLEVRAGASFGDAGALGNSDISGLSTLLGYRFVF